jgi:single-stranded-DNA-specific exonuclease
LSSFRQLARKKEPAKTPMNSKEDNRKFISVELFTGAEYTLKDVFRVSRVAQGFHLSLCSKSGFYEIPGNIRAFCCTCALMGNSLWIRKTQPDDADIQRFSAELGIEPMLCRMLLQRGISTIEDARVFFRPDLNQLHDPFLMKDMDKAVDRLSSAIAGGEKILVYGDYDVDGTTAVALVFSFLAGQGACCDYYIPDRFTEGYGFSFRAVEWAAENDFKLIITLDCGIKDAAKIDRANALGMDVLICDHHNPEELPAAFAVLDPKRADCAYPYKGLSGCGVGFKLLQGYCMKKDISTDFLYSFLDLLAISIGADIVPLTGENRVLATFGIRQLQENPRPGIDAMLELAQFKKKRMTITDVVFVLAPRINAAGRIMSGRNAVKLLISPSKEEALEMGKILEGNNLTRRGLDKDITASAIQMVDADSFYSTSYTTVVKNEGWSKGVIGIVASRLVETYYKPAVVLSQKDGILAGSARSISGIDLYEVLLACSDYLEQFGGHTMAAGLSMKEANFLPFRERFDQLVARQLGFIQPIPQIEYDMEIDIHEITPRFFNRLERFAPFGPENMKPVFLSRNLINAGFTKQVGEDGAHLKVHVKQRDHKKAINGIGFDLGPAWGPEIGENRAVDLLYCLEENEWNGQTTIQLMLKDIRHAEAAPAKKSETESRASAT